MTDLPLLVRLLERYPHQTTDRVTDGRVYRPFRVGAARVLMQAGLTDGRLMVTCVAHDAPYDRAETDRLARHWLGLDAPPRDGLREVLAAHPTLESAVSPVLGLPLLRAPDLFEPLMCAIIEQQISWRGALRAQAWLMDWVGDGLCYDGGVYPLFPTPERLAAASHEELLPLKITHKRIDLLRRVAEAVASGALDLARLDDLDEDGRMGVLTQLKGVGAWTAAVALGRRYGAGRVVPVNDVALQAAANAYVYGREGRLPAEALGALLAPLGVWAGTAAALLLCRWVIERY
jgi:DNA-3-methyladenine glycosylase II